jgi:hypothetical protein
MFSACDASKIINQSMHIKGCAVFHNFQKLDNTGKKCSKKNALAGGLALMG